jgi:hypothetical protein
MTFVTLYAVITAGTYLCNVTKVEEAVVSITLNPHLQKTDEERWAACGLLPDCRSTDFFCRHVIQGSNTCRPLLEPTQRYYMVAKVHFDTSTCYLVSKWGGMHFDPCEWRVTAPSEV